MKDEYIIGLNGLPIGKTSYYWHIGKNFFLSFENTDIVASDISINILVEKSGTYLGVDCDIEGTVTVECDRCLELLELPVSELVKLSYKFGGTDNEVADYMEGEREIVYLPLSSDNIDLSQIIYDYILLALPMQRVHEADRCNPKVVKYINTQEVFNIEQKESESPFAVLKGLLEDK